MKYFATFSANNGSTYLPKAWEYTNKAKAISEIKAAVVGSHYNRCGNKSTYMVTDNDGVVVAAGALHDCGWWSVDHDIIGCKF